MLSSQICDVNGNHALDGDEFEKCRRLNNLGLSTSEMTLLHEHFDRDRSGSVGYEEFLRAVRGRLTPVRKQLGKKIFDVLDKCERAPLDCSDMAHVRVRVFPSQRLFARGLGWAASVAT